MFKSVLDALDKVEQNGLSERIDKHPVMSKYWMALGGAIVLLVGAVVVNTMTMLSDKEEELAPLYSVLMKKDGKLDESKVNLVPITLPTAHHTFKNVSNWIKDAIGETYTFDFLNFYQQVNKAEQYFTPEGYQTYIASLQSRNVEKDVLEKKVEVTSIPIQNPVMINSGMYGETEFWRFRVPVLVSVQGSKEPVVDNYMMELLILRVPAHINHRGLAIAEYNMKKM